MQALPLLIKCVVIVTVTHGMLPKLVLASLCVVNVIILVTLVTLMATIVLEGSFL